MFGATLILGCIYAAVILAGGARAWSGSDAGGKVATVRAMAAHRSLVPDVGYWAARADPSGVYHPLLYTARYGNHWVQVTSLPFSEAGALLCRMAGASGLLILPALGSLLAAVAARRLARLLGARRGWAAFWLVGLGAPLFYAGDFWEHSAALGLALLAVCLALEDNTVAKAAAAGALAGAAAVLRTEMLVYAAAFALALLIVPSQRRRWLGRPASIVAGAVAACGPIAAERIAERLVWGTSVGASRVSALSASAGSQLGSRLRDAALTSFGLFADGSWTRVAVGALFVLLLAAAGWFAITARPDGRGRRFCMAAIAAGGILFLARVRAGAGFIPGLFAAAPLAIVGAMAGTSGWRDRGAGDRLRVVALTAVVALPLVWAFAWRGQQLAQWGGRYELLTGVLLTVVATVAIERAGGWARPAAAFLAAVTIAVAGIGATWHIQRSRDYARAVRLIDQVPTDTVIVSTIAHLGREGGAYYGDRRWLTVTQPGDTTGALAVAQAEGVERADVVSYGAPPPPAPAGWTVKSHRTVPLHGFSLDVWEYDRTGHVG